MKYLWYTFLLLWLATTGWAQGYGFKAEVIAGLAAAQIRGDDLAGYNQPGFEGGLGVSYGIRHNMDLSVELLYSQRGSRSDFFSTSDISYRLNYAAIPLVVYLYDWDYEDSDGYSFYKVNLHTGAAYGQLVSSSVDGLLTPGSAQELEDAFNKSDVSWLIGAGLQFNYRLGARVRYNRSLTRLFNKEDQPDLMIGNLVPYHLSLQLTYKLY